MSSPVQNEGSSQNSWSTFTSYAVHPIAAGIAFVPVFYGFKAKSDLQLGFKMPRLNIKESFIGGCKTAPSIALIIGTQITAQRILEKTLFKPSEDHPASFPSMLACSIIVGAASSPALAIFNGMTMRQSAMQSLKALSFKQVGAIMIREASFLCSVRVTGPVGEIAKRHFGDNKAIEYSSTFISGMIGSFVGHPADTALTLWQKGMTLENCRQSMRGALTKSLAVGGFAVGYNIVDGMLAMS